MALNNPEIKVSETKDSPKETKATTAPQIDTELDGEYIDKRSVTISLVHNYSNYRRVNMKVLGQRKETIGSSVRSCQILSSNAEEVNAYFP